MKTFWIIIAFICLLLDSARMDAMEKQIADLYRRMNDLQEIKK